MFTQRLLITFYRSLLLTLGRDKHRAWLKSLCAPWVLILACTIAPPVHGQQFVPGFTDLPLPPYTYPIVEPSIIETPDGRIATVECQSAVPIEQIHEFFAQSLPNLGWKLTDDDGKGTREWEREGEILIVELQHINRNNILIRFTATPNNTTS